MTHEGMYLMSTEDRSAIGASATLEAIGLATLNHAIATSAIDASDIALGGSTRRTIS